MSGKQAFDIVADQLIKTTRMDEETLDSFITAPQEKAYEKSIKWWEKKRLWFNLLVGATGLVSVLVHARYFGGFELFGVIMWGLVANIMFSTGLMLEIADLYYAKGRWNIHKVRNALFGAGTALYCLLSWFWASLYFEPIVTW